MKLQLNGNILRGSIVNGERQYRKSKFINNAGKTMVRNKGIKIEITISVYGTWKALELHNGLCVTNLTQNILDQHI